MTLLYKRKKIKRKITASAWGVSLPDKQKKRGKKLIEGKQILKKKKIPIEGIIIIMPYGTSFTQWNQATFLSVRTPSEVKPSVSFSPDRHIGVPAILLPFLLLFSPGGGRSSPQRIGEDTRYFFR